MLSRGVLSIFILGALALAACAAQPAAAGRRQGAPEAAADAAAPSLVVPEGTTIEVALERGLSSATTRTGDAFAATVAKDVIVDGRRAIPAGSTVRGIVKEARAAKRGDGAGLSLVFNSLSFPDTSSVSIAASYSDRTETRKRDSSLPAGTILSLRLERPVPLTRT